METGWGMPHGFVAILASILVAVRVLPVAAERLAARWSGRRG
jgi:hypothetical protein